MHAWQYQLISETNFIELMVIGALIVVIAALIRSLVSQGTSIVELLDKRFAAGELSIGEYQESRQTLARTSIATYARDLVVRLHAFNSRVGAYKHRINYLLADEAR